MRRSPLSEHAVANLSASEAPGVDIEQSRQCARPSEAEGSDKGRTYHRPLVNASQKRVPALLHPLRTRDVGLYKQWVTLLLAFCAGAYFTRALKVPLTPPPRPTERRPEIAIVSLVTYETAFDHLVHANRQRYCERHGYDMHWVYRNDEGMAGKLTALIEAIDTQRYDWLWWLDYDALITNHEIAIHEIISNALASHNASEQVELMLTRDCNGYNAGSYLIRPSAWSRQVSEEIRNCTVHDGFNHADQDCTQQMLDLDRHGINDRVIWLPQRSINAYPEQLGCGETKEDYWTLDSLAVHFAGAEYHIGGGLNRIVEIFRDELGDTL